MNKRIILITMLSIPAIISIATLATADTYEIYLDENDVLEDGYLYNNAQKTRDNSSTTITITSNPTVSHGYVMWDISAIPKSATILNASIEFYGTYSAGPKQTIYNLSSDTRSQSNASLYTDVSSGNDFNSSYFFATGFQTDRINTTSGDWTPLSGGNNLSYNVKNDLGWWGVGFKQLFVISAGTQQWATTEHAVYPPMCLWVEFEMTAPQINESTITPVDSSTDQCLNSSTSVWIQHDHGVPMNLSWYWYNSSNISAPNNGWFIYNINSTVTNGTYYANNTGNWTEPCTTYYWYVSANDSNENTTESVTFEYKTHCIDPPSNLAYSTINNTALNITWTPDDEGCGTTYTHIYYQHGAYPPAYGSGTFLGNFSHTTNYSVVNDLTAGQCYAFSYWSYWNSSLDGETWHLSSTYNSRIICSGGGDYRVTFYDEETVPHQPINFSRYPWANATHKLLVHYYQSTEDEILIHYTDPLNSTDITICNGQTVINVSASLDVAYFELKLFVEVDTNITEEGLTIFAPYTRKLMPSVVRNYTICGETRDTIDFYIVNRTVQGEPYYMINASGTYVEYLDFSFSDRLVQYNYYFNDETGDFISHTPLDTYISIYTQNMSGNNIVIHQEFIDALNSINPYLIYEKDYIIGASCSVCDNITNFGIPPTSKEQTNILTIKGGISDTQLFGEIHTNKSVSSAHTDIYFSYLDAGFDTANTTIFTYEDNSDGTLIDIQTSISQDLTYHITPILKNTTYYIVLVVNKSFTIEGITTLTYNVSISNTFYYLVFSGIDAIGDVSAIETVFLTVFHREFIENFPITTMILLFFGSLLFFGMLGVAKMTGNLNTNRIVPAFFTAGIFFITFNTLLLNFDPALYTGGLVFIIFGLFILIGGRERRLY